MHGAAYINNDSNDTIDILSMARGQARRHIKETKKVIIKKNSWDRELWLSIVALKTNIYLQQIIKDSNQKIT